jgi:hypothetical protein
MPIATQSPESVSPEGGELLTIPAEFLGGAELSPGDTLQVHVVNVDDDGSVEVKVASETAQSRKTKGFEEAIDEIPED